MFSMLGVLTWHVRKVSVGSDSLDSEVINGWVLKARLRWSDLLNGESSGCRGGR